MNEATPSRAARLAQIKDEASRLRGAAARTLVAYGVLMLEVEANALWREDGASSFTAWLRQHEPGRVTSIRRGMRIAANFAPDVAARFGMEKMEEGVRLLAVTPNVEKPGDLLAMDLRIRGPNGRFVNVAFVDAKPDQIRSATKIAAKAAKPKPPPDPVVTGLQEAVGTRGRISRDADGQLRVRVNGASVEELRALLAILEAST